MGPIIISSVEREQYEEKQVFIISSPTGNSTIKHLSCISQSQEKEIYKRSKTKVIQLLLSKNFMPSRN